MEIEARSNARNIQMTRGAHFPSNRPRGLKQQQKGALWARIDRAGEPPRMRGPADRRRPNKHGGKSFYERSGDTKGLGEAK